MKDIMSEALEWLGLSLHRQPHTGMRSSASTLQWSEKIHIGVCASRQQGFITADTQTGCWHLFWHLCSALQWAAQTGDEFPRPVKNQIYVHSQIHFKHIFFLQISLQIIFSILCLLCTLIDFSPQKCSNRQRKCEFLMWKFCEQSPFCTASFIRNEKDD